MEALSISHLLPPTSLGNYLFYPAQFWPHKNHIRIIEAVHHLKVKHNSTLHAVFAGSDKGTLNYLRNKAKELGLEDRIHFLGFVSKGELIGLYKNAFALCYVTLFGPENLPPLEAFSLGCPAIVSEVQGAREQYGSAALFFNPLNSEELATRILQVKNDPGLRDQLIAKGYQRAKDYTPDLYVKDIFKLLEEFRLVRKTWASE
jgi:glycosyltransferase involved in cell wall biosynthesis